MDKDAMKRQSILDAFERCLELNKHYAALLNQYDGGERMGFDSVAAWMDRLDEVDRNQENSLVIP